MNTMQVKLEKEYHNKLMFLCRRFGVTKTDLVRFMLDMIDENEITDNEFNRWYNRQNAA